MEERFEIRKQILDDVQSKRLEMQNFTYPTFALYVDVAW